MNPLAKQVMQTFNPSTQNAVEIVICVFEDSLIYIS